MTGKCEGELNPFPFSIFHGARRDGRTYGQDMQCILTAALTYVLPGHLARQVVGELRFSVRRAVYSRATRRRLSRLDGCRVNIGCGDRPTPGWVNLELRSSPDVHFWDCRHGLPFSNNVVAAIYSEHVFEHLDPETETTLFLGECLRCLRPGGVLRVVVPDAGAYLRAYGRAWAPLAVMRPLEQTEGGWRDRWFSDVYRTQMELINAVFRQRYEHKYAYDEETLILIFREGGFSHVIAQAFGVSIDPEMAPDSELRRTESLYLEAIK